MAPATVGSVSLDARTSDVDGWGLWQDVLAAGAAKSLLVLLALPALERDEQLQVGLGPAGAEVAWRTYHAMETPSDVLVPNVGQRIAIRIAGRRPRVLPCRAVIVDSP